jgi:hypothetical protein
VHYRSLVPTAALALIALACVRDTESATVPDPALEPAIVFVCQNGVAMSVWSALTFDRLAAARGLPLRAGSRAEAATFTNVPFRMKLALALDGLWLGDYRPQVISAADLAHAQRVILIDAELPASLSDTRAAIERWSGFPPMREQYFASRAALQTRVEELVARLQSPASP